MSKPTLVAVLLFLSVAAQAQVTAFDVSFDDELVGGPPEVVPGLGGERPTSLFGEAESRIDVVPVFGSTGASTAAGNVARVDAPAPGDYHLLDFGHALVAGIVTEGVVRVGFDFAAEGPGEGFAFLRLYDEAEEDIGSVRLGFDETGFDVGLLDYDSATGDFLGVVYPAVSDFAAGTWHRIELLYDLSQNTLRVEVDGTDGGVEVGLSRATGTGALGAFFNWGGAYAGRSAVDNVTVEVPEETGLPPAPAGFLDLLEPEAYGGTVLRPENGDLRTRGLAFRNSLTAPLYWGPAYDGVATYSFVVSPDMDESDARPSFVRTVPVQRNRTYEVSALIRTDFPRSDWEFSVIAFGVDPDVTNLEGGRYGGMPARTEGPDGWERWTWRFTPHWPTVAEIEIAFGLHEYGPTGFNGDVSIEIADFAVVELPEADLVPFAPGDGVTFPGGPGALAMRIDGVEDDGTVLTVETLGAAFAFDRAAGTLAVRQQGAFERDLALVTGLDLSGLAVQQQTGDLAVLVGSALTVGVQADGAAILSPHSELSATVESRLGGDFNRIAQGDLFSMDDFGGFTANVHTPLGTGRVPRLAGVGALPFAGLPPDDLDTPGAAAPGWQARAEVSPGERLFVSAFPSRAFDWEQSFEFGWSLAGFGEPPGDIIGPGFESDWILWNVNQRAWAMSFGPRYEPRDDVPFQAYVGQVDAAGDRWGAYFSQWFYFSRDPRTFADEVARWRDEYGMTTVYSDGLAQDDWLSAYVVMRLLRGEVFPEGSVIIHDSFPQSGVAAAAFRPFIYTYATATYMAENAEVSAGADWSWARYVTGQFRRANAVGVTKGDGWVGFEGIEKYLVALVWGGRGNPQTTGFEETYLPILAELETLWETYGDDPHFFDRYYHPRAQQLTGYEIGRAGMPFIERRAAGPDAVRVTLATWTEGASLRYTTDGSDPDETAALYDAPFTVLAGTPVRARAFKSGLDPSAVASGEAAVPVATSPLPVPGPFFGLKVYPNPARSVATVAWGTAEPGRVQLDVLDALGRVVRTLVDEEQPAGTYARRVPLAGVPSGVYLVRLRAGDQTTTTRLTVVH
ncbi:MAG: chitobiase/beta-hexosaminidase C-terminal domain-containing protein [Bacteroidota bacterium]